MPCQHKQSSIQEENTRRNMLLFSYKFTIRVFHMRLLYKFTIRVFHMSVLYKFTIRVFHIRLLYEYKYIP